MRSLIGGILTLAVVLSAGFAFAQEEARTERVVLVDGIKLYPTTTTDFGGARLHSEAFQGAGDSAGDAGSGDAGAAAGASSGDSGGDGCGR